MDCLWGVKYMPASKAQQKAVTKYVKAKYDRFGITMPKGQLDVIKDHATAAGESVNGYIVEAINRRMDADTPPVGGVGTSSGDGLDP